MRTWTTAALAGVAALALAAAPGLARAGNPHPHVLTIHFPDGSLGQIQYTGPVAPRVMLAPQAAFGPMPMPAFAPTPMPAMLGPDSPFAMLQRMSARMDREMSAMMRAAFTMPMLPLPSHLVPAGFGHAPFAGQDYSVITTINGNRVCTRSTTITSRGHGLRPQVVSDMSGDCGTAAPRALTPARQDATPDMGRHGNLIRVLDQGAPAAPRPRAWQG